MSEREEKLTRALSTAAWWLKELSAYLTPGILREQAIGAARDATRVVNASMNGDDIPDWLSPMFSPMRNEEARTRRIQCGCSKWFDEKDFEQHARACSTTPARVRETD